MKLKALINDNIICSLSRQDNDNLKVLQSCLPSNLNKEFSDEEKIAIQDYNHFIDEIIDKNKGKSLDIDIRFSKIDIK